MRIGEDIFIISENQMAGSDGEPHKVDVTTFIITDKGNARAEIDGRSFTVQSPCITIVLPGQTYQMMVASDDISFRAVIMSQRFTDGLMSSYIGVSKLKTMVQEYPILDISHDVVSFNTYYNMLLRTVQSPVKNFRLESARHLTLSMLYYYAKKLEGAAREKDKRQLHYEKFISDVQSHYKINRTLPFYAGRLGVSVTYLTELIKEKHGMTAADYIDKHTATECMALLNSTSLSINHISRMMNFPSSSVFGKFFKRMTGCSPTEYRGENI
jgi:AraC-like DNA-binding protein